MLLISITQTTTEAAAVVFHYQLENRREYPVYVADELFHTDRAGNRSPDPALCYVTLVHDELVFGKFLFPIPPGRKVEAAETPYLKPLLPGERHAGLARLPVPVRVYHPYLRPQDPVQLPGFVQASLRIGFFDTARILPNDAAVQPTPDGKWTCDYGLGVELQEFGRVAVPLTGLRP